MRGLLCRVVQYDGKSVCKSPQRRVWDPSAYRVFPSANLKEGVEELTAPQLPISSIVPVVAHAVAVFGDEHKASHWLSTPLALLENRPPSELLNSTEGIQRVEEILTRIEHNIFS